MDTQEVRRSNLKKVIAAEFGGKQARLAERLGLAAPTLSRIFNSGKKVGDVIREWEGKLGYEPGAFDRIDFEPGKNFRYVHTTTRYAEPLALPGSIPVMGHHEEDGTPAGFIPLQAITLEVGAGHRLTEGQEPETKARLYSLESLQRQRLRPSDLVAYKVRGNSMEPYLFDGDWVVIDRSRKTPPSIAKPLDCRCNTFVFRYEDGIMVKMLQALPDGGFNVVSLNRAEHKEFMIPASSVDRMEVYGKVVDRSGWSV